MPRKRVSGFCFAKRFLISSCPSLNSAFKKKFIFFFLKLSINAFDYNCHLDLIKLLRQEGELVKLRRARQKMSELFPLTEGMEHLLLTLQLIQLNHHPCKILLFQ